MQSNIKRSRFVKRLTPMSVMGKATQSGLEEAASKALKPHFHHEGAGQKKVSCNSMRHCNDIVLTNQFAIRPNIRNHSTILTRDIIITLVAQIVGPLHKVDLKDFDTLILVEVYQVGTSGSFSIMEGNVADNP